MVVSGRRFRLFWLARAASQFGDEISLLALPWLVAEETGSPLVVALLEVMAFTPILLLGLPLGALADRRSRKLSMIQSDFGRATLMASIPLAAFVGLGVSIVQVLIITAVVGCLTVLFDAASQAALPELVGEDEIVTANSRLGFTEGLAAVCGPALAGLLIATISSRGAIAVDAVTFLISAAAIGAITMPRQRIERAHESLRASMRTGLATVRRTPHIFHLTLVLGAANFSAGMAVSTHIIFFEKTLDLEGWQAGVIYAMNGLGGIAGSLVISRVVGRLGMGRTVLLGIAAVTTGVFLTALTTAKTWSALATAGSVLVGFGVAVAVISSASLRQHVVAGPLLGRVAATFRLVVDGAVAIGALVGGVIGEFIGIRQALVIAAGVGVVVCLAGFGTRLAGPDPERAEATPDTSVPE